MHFPIAVQIAMIAIVKNAFAVIAMIAASGNGEDTMKVRIPKSYDQLPHKDKEKLKEFTRDVALEAAEMMLEKDSRVILDIYMKMACLVLHDAFGFGEKRLRMFVGNHKRLFSRQAKLVQRGEQDRKSVV